MQRPHTALPTHDERKGRSLQPPAKPSIDRSGVPFQSSSPSVHMVRGDTKHHGGGGGSGSGSDVDLEQGTHHHAGSSSDLRAMKSVSPSHHMGKSSSPDEGRSPSSTASTASSSDGEKEVYLGKVPRKEHRKMKRSLGSGFELAELQQQHVPGHCGLECPPLILQLSPTSGAGGGERGSIGSVDEHDCAASSSSSSASSSSSVGEGEKELPPEDEWRDGVFGCFRGFGLTVCFATSYAQTSIMDELNTHTPTQRLLLLLLISTLWLSLPPSLYLHLYPLSLAALATIWLIESAVAFHLRRVMRRRYSIEGSEGGDCLVSLLFPTCVTAQILRHLRG